MSRPSSLFALAVAGLATVALPEPAAAQASSEPGLAETPFEIVELAEGVWAAVVVRYPPMTVFANALVVEGEAGVLVVDTHASPSAAEWLIDAIRARTDRPVRWVVNTHWHGDHVQGNGAYRAAFPGVEIVGHVSLLEDVPGRARERLDEERESLPGSIADRERWLETGEGPDGAPLTEADRVAVARSAAYRRRYRDEIADLELLPPTTTFEDAWTVDLGGRSVRLLHLGPAHTRGDVVVFLWEERILAVGDLLEEGLPWIDGDSDVAGWGRALERIEALDAAVFVPSHGGVQRNGALLSADRGFVGALAGAAMAAREAGEGPEGVRRRLASGAWRESLTSADPAREAALDRELDRLAPIAWKQAAPGSAGLARDPATGP